MGNDTHKAFNKKYYRARYNTWSLSASLIRDFWKRSSLELGFSYEDNTLHNQGNALLDEPGSGTVTGIGKASMAEARIGLDLDLRDNPHLPYRGSRLLIQHQSGLLTSESHPGYGFTSVSIEQYFTIRTRLPLTLALRFGGADSYGKTPFYRLPSLGQTDNLRGYARNRFTGQANLYTNTELRWQLASFRTAIVPVKLGIKGFFDVGRVYQDGVRSTSWHQGYGGGLYLVPFSERFSLNASVAFSEEERALLLVSIGTAFR